ncbi:hypothetical protein ABZV80_38285, partial [Streptomyces sp. NPDC005132]|uniref:hypothetical protein n=1 Tax=Streptomyces sp. NPDC005132 TaxID=3154294 RepID=UPI0033A1278B
ETRMSVEAPSSASRIAEAGAEPRGRGPPGGPPGWRGGPYGRSMKQGRGTPTAPTVNHTPHPYAMRADLRAPR